jgi:hypothetical protein
MKGVFVVADQPMEGLGLTELAFYDFVALCVHRSARTLVVAESEMFAYAVPFLWSPDEQRAAEPASRPEPKVTLLRLATKRSRRDAGRAPKWSFPDEGEERPLAWSPRLWTKKLKSCNQWLGIVLGEPRKELKTELDRLGENVVSVVTVERLSAYHATSEGTENENEPVELEKLLSWTGFAPHRTNGERGRDDSPPRRDAIAEGAREEALLAATVAASLTTALWRLESFMSG